MNKSKVMKSSRGMKKDGLSINMSGKGFEQTECFGYLGVQVAVEGAIQAEVNHMVNEGA